MRRVADGQPFSMSAEEFNSHQMAAAFATAQQTRRGSPPSSPLHEIDRTRPWVVNESSESIRAFSCVKITGVAATYETSGSDFYSKTPLKVNKPTGEEDSFLILQDGLPSQNMATRAISNGITPAWVNFEEGADSETTAGPTSDSFDLKAGGSGVEIVWKPEGIGSLLCVVRISTGGGSSCCQLSVMTLIEPLPAGGTAKAIPYVTEIPDDVTGIDVCDNIMPNYTTIPYGATIYVARFSDCKLRVIAVSCDALGDGNCGSGYLEDC